MNEADVVKSYIDKFKSKMKGSGKQTSAEWIDGCGDLSDKEKQKIWNGIQKFISKKDDKGDLPKWVTEAKQKMSDANIAKILSKGIKMKDPIFSAIAMSLRNYTEVDGFGRIHLQSGRSKLMDELWYRCGSSYEEGETYDTNMMKTLKKNFYGLEKKLFQNHKRTSNYYEEVK